MNRRGFLSAILAAGVAPAVVGSGILMPVRQLLRAPPDLLAAGLDPLYAEEDGVCGFGIAPMRMQWPGIIAWYERAYSGKLVVPDPDNLSTRIRIALPRDFPRSFNAEPV